MKKNTTKKIAIFCWRDSFNPKAGGAEYVTIRHAQAWIKKGHSVTWFAATVPGQDSHFKKDGIQFHRLGPEKLFFLSAGLQYFLFSDRNFDLIIDQIHGLPNFSTIWAPRTKKILLIHEVAGRIWEYMFAWPLSKIGEVLEATLLRLFYKNTAAWVDSLSTKNDLIEVGFKENLIQVIPCSIESTHFKKQIQKNKHLTLVFLARLVPMKGVHFALKVFKYVLLLDKKAQLLILGSGESEYIKHLKNLVQLSHMSDAVHFKGRITEKEKNEYLGSAHFLLHTSVKEGFGLTVLEANARHTPTAIFDVGSLNELVDDAQTGVIAPFHNEKKLAVKIYAVFKKPALYKKMSAAAFNFQKKYRWSNFVQMSTSMVEEL